MDSDSDSSHDSAKESMDIEYKSDKNCAYDQIVARHLDLEAFSNLSLSSASVNSGTFVVILLFVSCVY